MIPKKVEERIHQQGLINDLTALGTFLTGNKPVSVSFEEYKDRFLKIMELDREFLELYTQAQFRVSLGRVMRVLYCTVGAQMTISLIAIGEINILSIGLGIPTGLMIGNGISRILPQSKLEYVVESCRLELLQAGGPDIGGMRRIVKAGLKELETQNNSL